MIHWSKEKDKWLRENRGLSFQEIANAIVDGRLIASLENPSRAGQEIFVIWIQDYTWVVPFVIEEDGNLLDFMRNNFWLPSQASLAVSNAPVMQATGNLHGQVRELLFGVAEGIFDDP